MTYTEKKTIASTPINQETKLKNKTGICVTVHGHFYQPPRENPYLDIIERQPSAYPAHDWNERIYHECYRPNAFARIVSESGEVIGIVNNFEYMSFNIGPTLMSWLKSYDLEVYQRIVEADRLSAQRLEGHGNAIAQVYNHIIMPLANQRDKYTQIRWGKADFRYRFGRDPEGIWLAETAIDYDTVEALIDEGIQYTILAPSQAQRCRPLPTPENPDPQWLEVGGSQIDPTRPYRCFIADGRYLDIFFYDGPISRDMGFNDVLASSDHFVGRLGKAIVGDRHSSQIVNVATDGETFGHHKGGTEKCLAYAFTTEFPRRGWTVTNYGHYLSQNLPTWEVVLKPVTAWSCAHGVNRWQDDCGCGGGGGWHQRWRKPLRSTLDWLRDKLAKIYVEEGKKFFKDPWKARDEYVSVILDRSPENVKEFLQRHQSGKLNQSKQIDALRLLEMQRHTLLMYTSCGWFFDELSRPEGVQILRYAARAMELAAEVAGVQLEASFIRRLAQAPSNVELFATGDNIYHQLVVSAQIVAEQIAAQYAISSLLDDYNPQQLYCYNIEQHDYQKQQIGRLTLAVGRIELTSTITWETQDLVFAVLHLGGWDFHCSIRQFSGRKAYSQLKDRLFSSLQQASGAQVVLAISSVFGQQSFNLQHLLAEERHRIMQQLTKKTQLRLDQLYTQVYRENYDIMVAFVRDGLPVPQELKVAAEVALSHRCNEIVEKIEQSSEDSQQLGIYIQELEAVAAEAEQLHCQLNLQSVQQLLEKLIGRSLREILYDGDPHLLEADLTIFQQLIGVGNRLGLGLNLDQAQELYWRYLHQTIVPNCIEVSYEDGTTSVCRWHSQQIKPLLELGTLLAVEVHRWLV